MPPVLVTGPIATQDSPFLLQLWPKPSPVLTDLPTKGWPGWVDLDEFWDGGPAPYLSLSHTSTSLQMQLRGLTWNGKMVASSSSHVST